MLDRQKRRVSLAVEQVADREELTTAAAPLRGDIRTPPGLDVDSLRTIAARQVCLLARLWSRTAPDSVSAVAGTLLHHEVHLRTGQRCELSALIAVRGRR